MPIKSWLLAKQKSFRWLNWNRIVFEATSGERRSNSDSLAKSAAKYERSTGHCVALNRLELAAPDLCSRRQRSLNRHTWLLKKRTLARLAKDALFRRDKSMWSRCSTTSAIRSFSVAVASTALLAEHRRQGNVAILADDSNQIARLNEAICSLLHKDQPESTYGITAYEAIPNLKNLSCGDTLIAPVKTRHFQQGEM